VIVAGAYRETTLGTADDVLDADGVAVLSFAQAQDKARQWFAEQARIEAGHEPIPEGCTVRDAVRDYLIAYQAGHTKGKGRGAAATQAAMDAHILPALGDIDLAKLTTGRLNQWLRDVANSPARVRTRPWIGVTCAHAPRHNRAGAQSWRIIAAGCALGVQRHFGL
jgi:hypothetical protein